MEVGTVLLSLAQLCDQGGMIHGDFIAGLHVAQVALNLALTGVCLMLKKLADGLCLRKIGSKIAFAFV